MFSGMVWVVPWAWINWRYLSLHEIKLQLLTYTPDLFSCRSSLTLIYEVWAMLSGTWCDSRDRLVQGQDHHVKILVGPFQLRICCDSMKWLHMAEKEPTLFSETMLKKPLLGYCKAFCQVFSNGWKEWIKSETLLKQSKLPLCWNWM